MFNNSEELLKFIKDERVEMVDVRFCDLPGVMQHFTVPVSSFDQSVFDDGLGFDGSSIRGFQAIHESDMQLFPDPTTAYLDPFRVSKTLIVNFFIHDPITGEAYSRDPRNIAKKALAYLEHRHRRQGLLRPRGRVLRLRQRAFRDRPERRLLPHRLRGGCLEHRRRRTARTPTAATRSSTRAATSRSRRTTTSASCATRWCIELEKSGLHVERAHHEVGTAGQAEINYKFDELLKAADDVMKFKYIVKNVAWRNNKTATFMPKPIFGDNGSGMHVHQSIWNERRAPVLRRDRLRRPVRHGPPLHRRHPEARPVAAGLHQPDGELLPPPGAGLRGPDLAGLLASATARPACASRSRVPTRRPSASSSAAPTRRRTPTSPSRRCCSPASTASRTRSSRPPRSTRTSTSCRRTRWPTSTRCPRRSNAVLDNLERGPRLPHGRQRLHARPDRDLDRLQAHPGDPARAAAPAPARVRALLRHLDPVVARNGP